MTECQKYGDVKQMFSFPLSSAALLTKCGQCLFSHIAACSGCPEFFRVLGESRMAEADGFTDGSEGKLLKTLS